jgi:threonyl-tRNA synthetase
MAVVGDRELESGQVNVRRRDGGQEALAVEAFLDRLQRESQAPGI